MEKPLGRRGCSEAVTGSRGFSLIQQSENDNSHAPQASVPETGIPGIKLGLVTLGHALTPVPVLPGPVTHTPDPFAQAPCAPEWQTDGQAHMLAPNPPANCIIFY